MVKSISIFYMCLTLFIVFVLPLTACILMRRKKKFQFKPLFIGMLIFIVFQICTRIPLLSLVSKQNWFLIFAAKHNIITSFIIALSAGVFEEVGRYIAFRFLLKDKLSYENGINYGIGHGWIEAILFVGFVYINNLTFSIMINSGMFDKFAAMQFSPETIASIKSQITSLAPINFALAGFERGMAMIIQVAFSLIVIYGVMKKDIKFLLYAIIAHTLLDFPVAIIGQTIWIWPYIGVFAVASVVLIIKSKSAFEKA